MIVLIQVSSCCQFTTYILEFRKEGEKHLHILEHMYSTWWPDLHIETIITLRINSVGNLKVYLIRMFKNKYYTI